MKLFIIPSLLSENNLTLSPEAVSVAVKLDEFVVENEKTARHFLKRIQSEVKQSDFTFHLLNEHSTPEDVSSLKKLFDKGKDIGLLSEAGCPAVADPGAALVKMAHESNVQVVPLTGPSSILLALMSSGMNGQSFIFHGYLPRESDQRKARLLQIEKDANKKKQTQIFIEAPYRNQQLLNDILNISSGNTLLCIACDLTSKDEFIKTQTISNWKKRVPEINKRPAIFLIGS